jgi:hypothetical protein
MKFKVGDKVIANKKANKRYVITKEGWIGTVTATKKNGFKAKGKIGTRDNVVVGLEYEYFDLYQRNKNDQKIVITTDGLTTTAKLYDGKTVVKSAEAKCSPDDKFDFVIGANLAYDRLMRPETLCKVEKPVDQPAEYYNGKVVCIKAGSYHTAGKVYEVKNGVVNCDYDDSGEFTYNRITPVKTLEQLNANGPVQFIEFKGEVTND